MARLLFWTGVLLIAGSILLHLGVKLNFISSWFGRLPGDFIWEKGEFSIYVPLTSSILVSIVLSLILSLIFRK